MATVQVSVERVVSTDTESESLNLWNDLKRIKPIVTLLLTCIAWKMIVGFTDGVSSAHG